MWLIHTENGLSQANTAISIPVLTAMKRVVYVSDWIDRLTYDSVSVSSGITASLPLTVVGVHGKSGATR